MAAHHACGFHTERWAGGVPRRAARAYGVDAAARPSATPLAADPADLGRAAGVRRVRGRAGAELDAAVGDRQLVVRVDRIELSKNLLRGFHAFDLLLEEHPEWRERVVFAAFVYPCREGLPEYLAYRQEVEGLVERINARWATDGWTPILYDAGDDFPRSVAALQRSDVLLVNPIRDGLNLVAKEGPLLNERDGVLALSHRGGRVGRAGRRRRASGQPLRRRRHRRRAPRGAVDAADERRRRAASLRPRPAPARPPTGSPSSWPSPTRTRA